MKTIFLILLATVSLTSSVFSLNKVNGKYPGDTIKPIYSNGYLVHGALEILFTSEAYKCHRYKAISDYEAHSCGLCKKTYYSQRFEDVEGEVYTIYSNSECSVSSTGHHDNLDLNGTAPPPKDLFIR